MEDGFLDSYWETRFDGLADYDHFDDYPYDDWEDEDYAEDDEWDMW